MKTSFLPCANGLIAALILSGCAVSAQTLPPDPLQAIQTVVVIYAENRSFDNLYGLFPGADGIAQATAEQTTQLDHDGKPLAQLPPIWAGKTTPLIAAKLPNRPFAIDQAPINLPLSVETRDLTHRYYQQTEQINGGLNNRFAALSDAGGLTMGHYDGSKLALWRWAQDYVLADHFFMGAFGGSYLNHQWLVCACTPRDENAPPTLRAQLDGQGHLKRKPDSPASALQGPPTFFDGAFTPDGYSVNTAQPPYQPSGISPDPNGDPRLAGTHAYHLPPQTQKTVGDTLSEKNISWAWYAGGWHQAVADGRLQKPQRQVIYAESPGSVNFQAHHQPFNYYARFAPDSPDRAEHLKDGSDFLQAIADGTLPQVAFYKPPGQFNEHPGYTDVLSGDAHIADLLTRLRASKQWPNMAIIVTYDENGGFWDHVAPPKGDRWGPGSRIPALIISPFAKRGTVDHSLYDTTSIIKFLTRRHGLTALPGVRADVGDLSNAFNFPP
jgi:phospholipase C